MPSTGGAQRPGSAAAVPPGPAERARILSLIDFLAAYHARRNPPVHDIAADDLFLLRGGDLPGHQGFLERMRALYRDPSVAVPGPLHAIVSDAPSPPAGAGAREGAEPLLLPLPASQEQQAVLTQAQHSTGVTVLGPPGTGTSHMIANIISHHVAYGRRVLVVAEREQALRGLTGMLPAGIKDLTVSLTGADARRGAELESAAGQIRARAARQDPAVAAERIRQLTADLDAASRGIAATMEELLAAREAEAGRLPGRWAAGDTPTRAEAARWVAAQRPQLGYIDDPVAPSAARPLSAGELEELVRLARQVGADRADACARALPDLTAIPFAAELEDRFAELARLEASAAALGDAVHDWGLAVGAGRDGLRALAARCHAEMEWIAKNAGTWLGHVREQVEDPLLVQDWLSFRAQISGDRQEALRLRGILTAHRIVIPDVVEPALIDGLEQAKERLSELGKLGMFAGPAKRALSGCEVDGRPLRTVADIDLCLQQAALESLRERIRTSWHNQVARVGGSELDAGVPEDVLGPKLEDLGRVLAWPRTWAQVRADLAAAGIGSPAAADADTLSRLADVCVQACDQIGVQELLRRLRSLDEWLRAGAWPAAASPLWKLFADALSRRDLPVWHRLREELRDLQEIAPQARWLRELRGRLSDAAPVWAARILADPAAAGDPADFEEAWQWRQLDSWVRDAPAGPAPAELQARLEELSAQRQRITAELVSARAWRRLAESKGAIPVWIMPAARALTSFRPEADPTFDLLVVDEASQIGLAAVPLLALARKAIVIGDDKQAVPEDTGLDRQQVSGLLDEHLAAIPAYRTLFDPGNSLYDIAVQTFPGVDAGTAAAPAGERRPARAARPAAREVAASHPAAGGGVSGSGRKRPALFPYQPWTPRPLAGPDTAPPDVVIAGLREIVAAEGPIHARRAYRLYTLAAGGRRVGPETRHAFHAATLRALRAGEIRQLDDEIALPDNKTLYAPGGPTVLVRELGPRRLPEVPRSEVAKLVRYLGLAGAPDDEVKRAVLDAYGLARLTARTSHYLDECLRYRLRRPAAAVGSVGQREMGRAEVWIAAEWAE